MDLVIESVGEHVALSIPARHLVQFKGKWDHFSFVCGVLKCGVVCLVPSSLSIFSLRAKLAWLNGIFQAKCIM